MIFQQVEIIKSNTNNASRGIYTGVATSVGYAFMSIAVAGVQTIFNSGVRELSVSHDGWARRTDKWNLVRINDIIVYKDRSFKVVEISDGGVMNSRWLHFLLEEKTVKEIR